MQEIIKAIEEGSYRYIGTDRIFDEPPDLSEGYKERFQDKCDTLYIFTGSDIYGAGIFAGKVF